MNPLDLIAASKRRRIEAAAAAARVSAASFAAALLERQVEELLDPASIGPRPLSAGYLVARAKVLGRERGR